MHKVRLRVASKVDSPAHTRIRRSFSASRNGVRGWCLRASSASVSARSSASSASATSFCKTASRCFGFKALNAVTKTSARFAFVLHHLIRFRLRDSSPASEDQHHDSKKSSKLHGPRLTDGRDYCNRCLRASANARGEVSIVSSDPGLVTPDWIVHGLVLKQLATQSKYGVFANSAETP